MEEKLFKISDIRKSTDIVPSAVRRHYLNLLHAMACDDLTEIANRQRRLLNAGYEVPISMEHCERLLEN